MTTVQQMPAEIAHFLHDQQPPASVPAASLPPAGQAALARVTEVVMSAFAEAAGQTTGREVVWNLAREAATAPDSGQQGADLVRSVLDDRYHGTINRVVQDTGVPTATVGQLLESVAGAALAVMGRLVAENHWNAQQLGKWLRPHQAGPAAVPPVAPVVARPVAAAAGGGAGLWLAARSNALLLGVSLLAVAEFGYIIGTRNSSPEDPPAVAASAPTPSEIASGNAAPAADNPYKALPVMNRNAPAGVGGGRAAVPVVLKLKNGLRQVIGAASTESKLYQFLIDPGQEVDLVDPTKDWIGFDRIYFETNKAALTNESLWQLSNVASILKRFPAAKIKVGGYTDNSGNPLRNLQLSRERAKSTMDALVSMGVAADRLTAVGFGALDNIADNTTEEGRSLNRRVSMQVTQK